MDAPCHRGGVVPHVYARAQTQTGGWIQKDTEVGLCWVGVRRNRTTNPAVTLMHSHTHYFRHSFLLSFSLYFLFFIFGVLLTLSGLIINFYELLIYVCINLGKKKKKNTIKPIFCILKNEIISTFIRCVTDWQQIDGNAVGMWSSCCFVRTLHYKLDVLLLFYCSVSLFTKHDSKSLGDRKRLIS